MKREKKRRGSIIFDRGRLHLAPGNIKETSRGCLPDRRGPVACASLVSRTSGPKGARGERGDSSVFSLLHAAESPLVI